MDAAILCLAGRYGHGGGCVVVCILADIGVPMRGWDWPSRVDCAGRQGRRSIAECYEFRFVPAGITLESAVAGLP